MALVPCNRMISNGSCLSRSNSVLNISRISTNKLRYRQHSAMAENVKHEWIAILPDHDDVLEKRMEIRPKHLAGLKTLRDNGFWKFGGAWMEEVPKEREGSKMKGSIMLALASSKEEVVDALKSDPYFKSDVWDWDKVQIYPFRSAFREPL